MSAQGRGGWKTTDDLLHGSTKNTPCFLMPLVACRFSHLCSKSADDNCRRRLLGNSWHLGVVRLFLLLILVPATAKPWAHRPVSSKYPAVQRMIDWALVD